ncbi:MAG: phosphohistidine phosphatase [Desulfobacterales bacterium SG8_35_2]|jgi:phosphohistidine phosphatase|nr:MAG: phosphohistidine phosphatase [Desulfobacterales bacterium SG8_35_2]
MALFLVQHGKSLPKEKDPDQGLSREGLAETQTMATLAAENNVQVMRIIHSGKKRALQTAEIFVRVLEPETGMTKGPGLAPLDDVTIFASTLNNEQNIMVVGHLPFMEKLVSYLITGSQDTSIIKFQNSSIICLDHEELSDTWFIRWALFPRLD